MYTIKEKMHSLSKIEFFVCNCIQFGKGYIFVVWCKVKVVRLTLYNLIPKFNKPVEKVFWKNKIWQKEENGGIVLGSFQ